MGRRLMLRQVDPDASTEGLEVIASPHGLDSHAGDVTCVKRAPGRVSEHARVAALIYIATLAPDGRLGGLHNFRARRQ